MTPEQFQSAMAIASEIRELFYRAMGPKRRAKLREALGRLKSVSKEEVTPYVRVQIGVIRRDVRKCVVFGGIDVTHCDDGALFAVSPEPTPRTYSVDNCVITVPDYQCPKCLGEWRLNLYNDLPCPECGAEFGKDVKVVVVDDVCPFCEQRLPSNAGERCECGFDRGAEYVAPK